MQKDYVEFRLPIPPDDLRTLGVLFLAAILIVVGSWLVSNWPYKKLYDRLPRLQERFGANVIAYLAILFIPIWVALVLFTLDGIFNLWHSPTPTGDDNALANRIYYLALVGLMGALAALLATPLGLYRVFTTERQTTATEEGLITDRINKAVEGLGSVKVEESIGRAVTVFYGESNNKEISLGSGVKPELEERSRIISTKKRDFTSTDDTGEIVVFDSFEIQTWEKQRTEIEWRNHILEVEAGGLVAEEGNWQVFKQTVPNLEVRIGAIYALERIAQDSLRDHIQITEILCAYIRENSKTESLESTQDLIKRPIPREDIQTAITVLGRRGLTQKAVEVQNRYRLDLRRTDLSGVNFSEGDFSAGLFSECNLEAARFSKCDLEGTRFDVSVLN